MATPEFQVNQINASIIESNAGSLRINTFDRTGTPVDVSSGYTLTKFDTRPSQQSNDNVGNISLLSHVTAAFDATGVLLTWTAAQASSMSSLLPVTQNSANVGISNDSGTTTSQIGFGSLLLDIQNYLS